MSGVSNLMMWSRHLFLTRNESAIRYVESTIIDNVSEKNLDKGAVHGDIPVLDFFFYEEDTKQDKFHPEALTMIIWCWFL